MIWVISCILVYLAIVIIGFAYLSYGNVPLYGRVLLFLAAIFPLITLLFGNVFLENDHHFSLTNAGPAGDWIAGSTGPFLTLATFWIAFETFKTQRQQMSDDKKENLISRRQPIMPFLHLEIIGLTSLNNSVQSIYFKSDEDLLRLEFPDAFAMKESGYDTMEISITNIGLGLATNMIFEKFGGFTALYKNKSYVNNLDSFFIQQNDTKNFLLHFPTYNKQEFNYTLDLSFCDITGNIYTQEYLIEFHGHGGTVRTGSNKVFYNYFVALRSEGFPIYSE